MADLQKSVAEALEELAELQSSSRELLQDAEQSRPDTGRKIPQQRTCESAWARTGTQRVGIPCHSSTALLHHSAPMVVTPSGSRSSSTTRQVPTGGYTMSKTARTLDVGERRTPPQVTPASYDPKVTALSTKKRTRGFTIVPDTRSNQVKQPYQQVDSTPPVYQEDGGGVSSTRTKKVGGYSFGKAEKVTDPATCTTAGGEGISELDIERATRFISEKPTGGTFAKESRIKTSRLDDENRRPTVAVASTTSGERLVGGYDKTNSSSTIGSATEQPPKRVKQQRAAEGVGDSNIEKLSHRSRAPAVRMMPEKSTKPLRKEKKDHSDYGTPGPGAYYDLSRTVGGTDSDLGKKRMGAFTSTTHQIPLASRAVLAQQKYRPTPGPGEYQIDRADPVVRNGLNPSTSTQTNVKQAFSSSASDSKPTPQLLKKRYFEEKARDMREETDGLAAVNYSHVSARTPFTAKIHSDESAGVNARNRQILRDRKAEKAREGQGLVEASFAKKHHLTEKRVVASVHMGQQVQSEKNTQARLQKAGIPDSRIKKKLEEQQAHVFLGPQLPTPWVPDRLIAVPTGPNTSNENDEDEEIEEALALLRRREPSVQKRLTKKEADREDLAAAFLRSSHTGLGRKPAIKMDVPVVNKRSTLRHEADTLTKEQRNRDFLPTQVHQAWGDEKPGADIAMARHPGRDSIKVIKKGVLQVDEFNKGVRPNMDAMGPGKYFNEDGDGFGDQIAGGPVKFEAMTSRAEVGGPRGEKPALYQQKDMINDDGYVENLKEELILEQGEAKEKLLKRAPDVILYGRDRHAPPAKIEDNDHLGGSWFEGMATEVGKQSGQALRYDHQTGRPFTRGGADDEKELLGDLMDIEADGDVMDLEVKNWRPHKERTLSAPAWQDAEHQPRFEVPKLDEKPDDAPRTPSPNFRYGKPREGVGVLDMGMQPSRWDGRDFADQAILEEIDDGGGASHKADVGVAQERDQLLANAESKKSSRKKEIFLADMSRQSKKERQSGVKSEAPDVAYNVVEGVQGHEQRRDQGVLAWDKQQGRDLDIIDKDRVVRGKNADIESHYLSDEEQVDVDPLADKTKLSHVKRTVYLPAWSEAKGPTRPPERSTPGAHLEYDPDTDFGKPGPTKTVGMDKQSGRRDNKTLREVGADEFDLTEELDLHVDGTVKEGLKFSNTGGAPGWSKAKATDDAYAGKGNKEDEGEELILNPKKSDWDWSEPEPSGLKGRKDGLGRGGARSGDDGQGLYVPLPGGGEDLTLDRPEELELNPKNMNLELNNVQAQWSKKAEKDPSRLNRPSLLNSDIDAAEELKLVPVKPSNGTSGTAVSWNKSADDRHGDRNSRGLQELVEVEELILAPKGPRENAVVQSASWQKQSSDGRGDRNDPARDTLLDKEELKLSPKEVRRPQKGSTDWTKQTEDSSRRRDYKESFLDEQEELKLSPKEIGRGPVSTKAAFKTSGRKDDIVEENSLSEELKLSPREVTKKSSAVPDKAPTISEKAKQKAIKESRLAAEAARQESGGRQDSANRLQDAEFQAEEGHEDRPKDDVKHTTVTWKDEVPGGDHRITEGSPHVSQQTAEATAAHSRGGVHGRSGSRKQAVSKGKPRVVGTGSKGGTKKDTSKRVQSSVSRAFNSVEEPSPPVIKAPTPTSHVPEGFQRGPSTVKHFSSNVSQAYDSVGHEPLPEQPVPRQRRISSGSVNGRRTDKKFVSNVSRAYDDVDRHEPVVKKPISTPSRLSEDLADMSIA